LPLIKHHSLKFFLLFAIISPFLIFIALGQALLSNKENVNSQERQLNLNLELENNELKPQQPKSIENEILFVKDFDQIIFLENFEKKNLSTEIKEKLGCKGLISGGFFNENYSPIGLFIINNKKKGEVLESEFFNGFVAVEKNTLRIFGREPSNFGTVFQTGPLIFFDGKPLNIKISNDKPARRIILANTKEKKDIFLVLYSRDNVFSGPFLSDVPKIVGEISNKYLLEIINAVNLDGGAHSIFITDRANLTELSPAGSFFCLK